MPTRRVVTLACALVVGAALALPASAQLMLDQLLLPPRALAMGSASTAMRNELEVSLGNPAGLSQLARSGVAVAAGVSGDLNFMGVGVFGTSGEHDKQYAFTVLDMDDTELNTENTVVAGSLSFDVSERLSMGSNVKWLFAKPSTGESDDRFTLDLGLQYLVSPQSERSAVVGVAVSNIFDRRLAGVDQGTQFAIGAQAKFSDEVLVAADVGDLFNQGPERAIFRAGMEVELGDNILVRAGVHEGDGSIGAAFRSGKTRVEVGWRPNTELRGDIVTVGASSDF